MSVPAHQFPICIFCWSHPVAPIWDQGGGIRIWGWLEVAGFRTGVWNFVGAGLGILGGIMTVKCNTSEHVAIFGFTIIRSTISHSCEHQSNSSWSSSVFWEVFWLVISSLVFGYVWIEGMIILFFCHSFVCFIFVILWECWASGGVLKYSGIGESCHATMQIHTNTNSLLYLLHHSQCHLFDYPGPQFAWEHYFQHRAQEESKKHNRGTVFVFFKGFWQPETTRDSTESWSDVQRCEQR